MSLTDDELALIRSWVGETPTEEEISDRFDRLGSVSDTIGETLRTQLARLVSDRPASITLPSGLRVDYSAGIKGYESILDRFLRSGSDGVPNVSVSKLYRPGCR